MDNETPDRVDADASVDGKLVESFAVDDGAKGAVVVTKEGLPAESGASPVDNEPPSSVDENMVESFDVDGAKGAVVVTKGGLPDVGDPAGSDSFDKAVEAGARIIPTPPKTRSNPVSSKTPPRKGSRGGNLVLSTSSISWAEHKVSFTLHSTLPFAYLSAHSSHENCSDAAGNDT